jgi:cobalamin synthase
VDSRDQWQRRAGPFYSLLVAGKQQTRLPLAKDLEPSSEDVVRSWAWLPIAGLILGCGLAVIASLLLRTALVPIVVAALVVALGVFATGGWLELGVARAVDALMRSTDRAVSDSSSVTMSVVLVLLVVLEAAMLVGTRPSAWVGALVVSHLVGRWSMLLAIALPRWRSLVGIAMTPPPHEGTPDVGIDSPSWLAIGVASGVAFMGSVLAGGAAGALSFAIALPMAWLTRRLAARPSAVRLDSLAACGAITQLAALLCFAGWSPASL